MWVLTGDKIQTAVNIGFSCKLLTQDMLRLYLDAVTLPTIREQLKELKRENGSNLALILAGESLQIAE